MSNFNSRIRTSKASALRSRALRSQLGVGTLCETLEPRQLLAAVFWDGGAGTNNWNDAGNWNRGGVDALPMGGDDVTIDVPVATPTITYASGTLSLNSLVSNEALTVTGGTLGLGASGTADINALLTLNGGGLSGGTWDVSGGSITTSTNSNNRLTGVTINGNIDLTVTSATLRISGGLTLNGTITISGSNTNFVFDNTGTLGGTGTILFTGDVVHDMAIDGNTTLTIGSGITIRGTRGIIGGVVFAGGNNALINQGTITADAANASGITIVTDVTTSNGTIGTTTGGTLTMGGAWNNAGGTFLVNNGILNLGGTFNTAGVGTFNRVGGTVNLTGSLANTAATLNLNASTGTWIINGGTISGGTVNITGGAGLTVTTNSNNRLTGTTINGNIDLTVTSATLRISGGLTLNGTITIAGSNTNFVFDNTGTLGGTGTILFVGDVVHDLAIDGNSTLTIGPGITIRGARGTIGGVVFAGGNNALINQGTISADAANATGLTIVTDVTTNTGTMSAITSGRLTMGGAWSNAGGTFLINDGILNLGGTFNTAGVGTFNRTGGTVNLTGTLDNAAATLNLNASTGIWIFNGGTISGGTVNIAAGTAPTVTTNSNNRLTGVTINGNIDLAATSATLRISNGLTLNGTITIAGGNSNLVFDNTGTLGGTGTILFTGDVVHDLAIDGNSTLTIAPGITIRGARGTIGGVVFAGGNNLLINQGTISADAANASGISIITDVTNSTGTMSAVTGGTLNIGGAWNGTGGTILVNAATVNLGGTFAMTGVSSFNRTGGTVNLTGTMTGAVGDVFNLNASTGSWVINGGGISGGTVNISGGSAFTVTTNSNNRLTGTTINGNIDLAATSATLRISGGLTLNGTVTIAGSNSNFVFDNTGTLGGTGTILFTGDVVHDVAIDGNSTLTIGPGITIRGPRGTIGGVVFAGGNSALINQGTITADVANPSGISIVTDVTTNSGTIATTMGGTLNMSGAWNNSGGTFLINAATLNLGGTFQMTGVGTFNRTAGTVNLTGTLSGGVGDVFNLNASTGTWVINGGTISGGSVTISGGAALTVTTNSNNRLTGTTINGNIDLAVASATLRISGGLTLNGTITMSGSNSNFVFDNTGTLGGTGTILFAGDAIHDVAIDGNSTLTIGPGITIRGPRGTIGGVVFAGGNNALINQGTIISDTNNVTGININADVFTNEGTIAARTSGKLTITPAVGVPVALTNSGTIVVGSLGVIRVNGNFVQTAAGTFRVEISGIAQPHVGKLVVTGTATLNGTYSTVGVVGFVSTCMNVEVLTAATVIGEFAVNDFVTPPVGFQSIAVYPTGSVRFAISQLSDWNQDGFLNSQDFFDFLASFFALSPEADFNNDGFINSQDFFDFISSFFFPCP